MTGSVPHGFTSLSSSHEDLEFTLPEVGDCHGWELLVDTGADEGHETHAGGAKTLLMGRSLKLFRCPRER